MTEVGLGLEERLRSVIRDVPDFPRRGIVFKDLTTVFQDAGVFHASIGALAGAFSGQGVDRVVGIESRGFVLGGAVAYELRAGFVPVRKHGKLPAETLSVAYELEYGEAVLEIHRDALQPGQRVLVIDDLLATGGTAAAAVSLVEGLGARVIGAGFVVELSDLGGARLLAPHTPTALVRF